MDGDYMSASDKRLIETHLETCPHCAGGIIKITPSCTMVSCLKGICINEGRRLSAGIYKNYFRTFTSEIYQGIIH